jgi:hypothetical protein
VESSTLDEARATFGFDLSSELHVIADPGAFFVDPDAGDYRFADGSRCAGSGRR